MYLFVLAIILACSNDIDILTQAVLNDSAVHVEERDSLETESQEEILSEGPTEGTPVEDDPEDDFEARITEFPPIEDVYMQNGEGYDQTIIRLDENNRTSYLKFDLRDIDAIEGYITDATLKFTVDSDPGNGTINIYKGIDSDWTEQEIDNQNVPEIDILLGSIIKEYKIGDTEEIVLSSSDILAEKTSLILQHEKGNDLAIASKEHPLKIGPKLRVKYKVPKGADPIEIIEEEPAPPAEEDTPEEENSPTENEAPMAIADATPSGGGAPLVVTFTGGNSSDDKAITSYEWDFKDGGTSTTANPTHTYTEVGTYEAELTVTDAEGLSATDTVTITINEEGNEAPVSVIGADRTSGEAPLAVKFTGSNSADDNGIASYAWDFKDGGNSTNANPTHTFDSAGSYNVELTVTDENGLTDKATTTITVSEPQNEAPVSVIGADRTSGEAPLVVKFTGSNSTDDNEIATYVWNFKDGGSSTNANPTHTFDSAGSYIVELTVTDQNGLTDKASVTIAVNEPQPQNQAPVALASANPTSGDAPLNVSFNGTASTDDKSITQYLWDFGNNETSSVANPSLTYDTPGVYNAQLTVTDAEGLSSTDTVTITVSQGGGGQTGCSTNGGAANESGLKVWCWEDFEIPVASQRSVAFSDKQLRTDTQCDPNSVKIVGDKIRFYLDPLSPDVPSWCSKNYNMRAEVRTHPYNVNNPIGTEEWYGWSYTFGNGYKIDRESEWLFWQVHHGLSGSPPVELRIIRDGQHSGHPAGEIYVINKGNGSDESPTGVTPLAGQTIDIVVHVIWGNASNGLLQVWLNGNKVYDKQVSNTHANAPWGGNAKWGIYKWPWEDLSKIQESSNQGISNLETFMGPLRMITRFQGDANYGKDSYSEVAPR
ncbi:MAG: PKD domain-containing protein [Aurantibacter sp.]